MGKINKLPLPITILLASLILGGFFYASQVNKQESIERQQLEEQLSKERVRQALDTCIADAEERSSNFWNRECKAKGLLTTKCISLNEITFDEYVKQNNISQDKTSSAIEDFYKEKSECSCLLPQYNADRIDESLKRDKDECFRKYPE